MTVLGEAAAVLTYDAYKASKLAGGVLGGILEASEAAAVAAILADTALVLGAGLAGYAIGSEIMRRLERPETLPPMSIFTRVPAGNGKLRVIAEAKVFNAPKQVFDNVFDSPLVAPVKRDPSISGFSMGVLSGTPLTYTGYIGGGEDLYEELLTITSITKLDGTALPAQTRMPTFAPKTPPVLPSVPTTLPVPGYPEPFPITPTVLPNPDNNPDTPDEERSPGVIVQVPQTGQQIVFTPTGVKISNYQSPSTAPFQVPSPPPPATDKKVATEPCPCPPCDLKEVLCRLKAIEKGVLNDGYDYTTHAGAGGNSGTQSISGDEPFSVTFTTTQKPLNAKNEAGGANAPEVTFSGWFAYIINGNPSSRIPIHYGKQTFLLDKSVTGYLFSGYVGFEFSSEYTTRKARPFVDNC